MKPSSGCPNLQDALGIDEVGINDKFFTDWGGHSLLAIRIGKPTYAKVFSLNLSIKALFDAPNGGRTFELHQRARHR